VERRLRFVSGQAHRQHDTMDPLGLLRARHERRKHRGGRRARSRVTIVAWCVHDRIIRRMLRVSGAQAV
jgi:hypothetical protein